MKPINRLHSIDSLAEIIARELAVFHDGIENTLEDYLEESNAIAGSIKEHIKNLIANRPNFELEQTLSQLFDIDSKKVFNNQEFNLQSRPAQSLTPRYGQRRVLRRSSANDAIFIGRNFGASKDTNGWETKIRNVT